MLVAIADNKTAGFFKSITRKVSNAYQDYTPTGILINKTKNIISDDNDQAALKAAVQIKASEKATPQQIEAKLDPNIFRQGPEAFINSSTFPWAKMWAAKQGKSIEPNNLWHALYFKYDPVNFTSSAIGYKNSLPDAVQQQQYVDTIRTILTSYFNNGEIMATINSMPYLNIETFTTAFFPDWGGEWMHASLIIKDFKRFLENVVTYAETLEGKPLLDYGKTIKSWIKKYVPDKKWTEKIDQEMGERLDNTIYLEEKLKAIQAAKDAADLEYQQKKAAQKKIILYAVLGLGSVFGLKKLLG